MRLRRGVMVMINHVAWVLTVWLVELISALPSGVISVLTLVASTLVAMDRSRDHSDTYHTMSKDAYGNLPHPKQWTTSGRYSSWRSFVKMR